MFVIVNYTKTPEVWHLTLHLYCSEVSDVVTIPSCPISWWFNAPHSDTRVCSRFLFSVDKPSLSGMIPEFRLVEPKTTKIRLQITSWLSKLNGKQDVCKSESINKHLVDNGKLVEQSTNTVYTLQQVIKLFIAVGMSMDPDGPEEVALMVPLVLFTHKTPRFSNAFNYCC